MDQRDRLLSSWWAIVYRVYFSYFKTECRYRIETYHLSDHLMVFDMEQRISRPKWQWIGHIVAKGRGVQIGDCNHDLKRSRVNEQGWSPADVLLNSRLPIQRLMPDNDHRCFGCVGDVVRSSWQCCRSRTRSHLDDFFISPISVCWICPAFRKVLCPAVDCSAHYVCERDLWFMILLLGVVTYIILNCNGKPLCGKPLCGNG